LTVLLIAWAGYCWLLRGGAFGALCRRWLVLEPGTTITRIVSMGALVAPFAFLAPVEIVLALWLSSYVASTIGYFGEAMGIERGARDVVLMSAWGLVVFSIALSPAIVSAEVAIDLAAVLADPAVLLDRPILIGLDVAWRFVVLGAVAGPVYAINKEYGRALGLDWTERSEICIGAALGGALSLAMA